MIPAIEQAIRLNKYPEEMAWLCFNDSELPDGMTDLLRLCSSKSFLLEFSVKNNFDSDTLNKALLAFIEKVMLVAGNSDEKTLGTKTQSSFEKKKLHFQLLMRIYHPDVNSDPKSAEHSQKISHSYQRLKQQEKMKKNQATINVSDHRIPPKSYYQATQKAGQQISNTKTAIALVSAITIFTLVAMAGHLYDPAKPELVTLSTAINTEADASSIPFKRVALNNENNSTVNTSKLQILLSNLETAYETGDVALISPILANTPEIKGQTDKELNDKLETLFKITQQRKMVLFDFEWKNRDGQLQGTGKFLSRYQLTGEDQWLARGGKAIVTTEQKGNTIKVTHLVLENQSNKQ